MGGGPVDFWDASLRPITGDLGAGDPAVIGVCRSKPPEAQAEPLVADELEAAPAPACEPSGAVERERREVAWANRMEGAGYKLVRGTWRR